MSFSVVFSREERVLDEVKIALVGKYTKLEDAYISVLKALKHASLHCNRSLKVVVGFLLCLLCCSRKIWIKIEACCIMLSLT